MPKILTQQQIDTFHRDGCVFPIRVMSREDAAELRQRLEHFEATAGGPLKATCATRPICSFRGSTTSCDRRTSSTRSRTSTVPTCCAGNTNFFIKEANHPAFVSWHQDSTYWGLSRPDVVTAWVALTPSNARNGAMNFIPGTHLQDQVPHRDTFAKDNLLTRGQEIAVDVDASKAVTIELEPGEIHLHHVRLVHGSPANPSDDRRIGFAIRYIPTSVAQVAAVGEIRDSATLVRGTDRFGYFDLEPRPSEDMEPAFVQLHKEIAERSAQILYRGTDVKSYNDPKALRQRA